METDASGFTFVVKKGNRRRPRRSSLKSYECPVESNDFDDTNLRHEDDDDTEDGLGQLCQSKKSFDCKIFAKEMRAHSRRFSNTSFVYYMKRLLQDTQKLLQTPPQEIVCYGLGNFTQEQGSREQLKLLICLRSLLNDLNCKIFDPDFTENERRVLTLLKFELIQQNELCRHRTQNLTKLFFMPRCHKFMYNNLLQANWSVVDLPNVVILGNSFDKITSLFLESGEETEYAHLFGTVGENIVREKQIADRFQKLQGFNDMSIHTFNTSNIQPAYFDKLKKKSSEMSD